MPASQLLEDLVSWSLGEACEGYHTLGFEKAKRALVGIAKHLDALPTPATPQQEGCTCLTPQQEDEHGD